MAIYPIFENSTKRDPEASVKEGREVHVDCIKVKLRIDGNTEIEKDAEEWLAGLVQKKNIGLIDPKLFDAYKSAFEAFKEGNEVPLSGTDIRQWPQVSRAEAENFINVGIRTVEDLAGADENTLRRIKHGAREAQNKAKAFLEASEGKAAEKIVAMEEKFNIVTDQNEKLLKALNEEIELRKNLEKEVGALKEKKVNKKPKDKAA